MSLLTTVKPENASGEMKSIYDHFINGAGQVPKPMEMFSASPGLFRIKAETISYYGGSNLSFPLLTLIRYLSAENCSHGACVMFNGELAKRQGMTEEELEDLKKNPKDGPLEERENQLLSFVVDAVKNPDSIAQKDIDLLKCLGWTEQDIFEAVNHGVDMVGSSILMKAFKI